MFLAVPQMLEILSSHAQMMIWQVLHSTLHTVNCDVPCRWDQEWSNTGRTIGVKTWREHINIATCQILPPILNCPEQQPHYGLRTLHLCLPATMHNEYSGDLVSATCFKQVLTRITKFTLQLMWKIHDQIYSICYTGTLKPPSLFYFEHNHGILY